MKALVITETLRSDSGTGRYSSATLGEYPGLGVEPTVLTAKQSGMHGELCVLFPLTFLNLLRNAYRTWRIARSFAVVHAFDVWPYGVYAYLAVLLTRKKLFLNGVGTYSVAPERFSLKRVLMTLAYRRAEQIYCISEYTERRIRERYPRARTSVALLGTTSMPRASEERIREVQARYQLAEHSPVFITVGQIKHRKGQLDTLCALAKLKRDIPDFLYLMVGSDDDKVYVDALRAFAREQDIEQNIRIISGVDDVELSALYSLSHVFCLTSNNDQEHFEGFGLVFLEAAEFLLPGIGSRECGIESAVRDGYSGYLARQGDAEDIASKIRLLLSPEVRTTMGAQAKNFASGFSWNKTAKLLVSRYSASAVTAR